MKKPKFDKQAVQKLILDAKLIEASKYMLEIINEFDADKMDNEIQEIKYGIIAQSAQLTSYKQLGMTGGSVPNEHGERLRINRLLQNYVDTLENRFTQINYKLENLEESNDIEANINFLLRLNLESPIDDILRKIRKEVQVLLDKKGREHLFKRTDLANKMEISATKESESHPETGEMVSEVEDSSPQKDPNSIKIFISYSKADKSSLDEFKKHLFPMEMERNLETWDDNGLIPGRNWNKEILKKLKNADIIILLTSANSLATKYIYNVEMKKAIERHTQGEVTLIPVILSSCNWKRTPLKSITALPDKAIPINQFEDQDEAWIQVTDGIEKVITKLAN